MASQLLRNAMQQLSSVSRLVSGAQLAARPAVAPRRAAAMSTRASVGKRDLINTVREKTGVKLSEAEAAVNATLETIVEAVARGEKVTIPSFGTFEARVRAARQGRNPQTGETIQIKESVAPAFSAGKGFKETVKAAAPKPQ